MDEQDTREDEQSDLFSVKPYASGNSIPVIVKVPLTKEEVRRRATLRVIYVISALAVVAVKTGDPITVHEDGTVEVG